MIVQLPLSTNPTFLANFTERSELTDDSLGEMN
jgi:hypothetical protein